VTNPVTTIKPHLAGIECPDVLRALPGWVIWRYETHDGEDKPRKVPFYVSGARRHGVQGRPEDRQQLVTFDAARTAAIRRGFDGVGFCLMPEWGIVALDFDGAIIDGGLHPEVERLVAGTYAEWSPSGQGVRAFMRGDLGNRKDHQRIPFGFETFSSKGFVTLTGNVLPITELTDSANTVADVSEPVRLLCMQRFGRSEGSAEPAVPSSVQPLGLTPDQLQDALDVLDPSMGHDPWLRVGMALHHETAGEGFELWDTWSSHGVQYPGRESLQSRWESFGRGGQRPTTAHALVRMANDQGAHIEIAQLEADDFDVVAAPAAAPKPSRFQLVQAGSFASGKPMGWIIKDVLPRAEVVMVYGESGSGKSFVVLDLGGAVARGTEWRGKRTKKGRVVYVVAEGAAGFRNRLKAYATKHGIDLTDLDVWVIHAAPNMLLKEDALDVCKSILASGGADLVIVDTFAQVTPGANENAAEDMGKALAHCRGIHVATGAVVLLVHHSGKDQSRGARGWSGLKGAMDTQIEVLKLATGRMLRVSKQKDGEDGLAWGFELDQVPVGHDEDGDVITSCVVRETDAPAIQQVLEARRGLGKLQRAVLAVVDEMAQAQTDGIEVDAVLTEVVRRTGREGTRNAKSHAMRALNEICERDDVAYEIHDGVVRVV
jgi:RecA/RadA recombinase